MTLPAPAQAFEWRAVDGRAALVCRALEPFARHLFTTSDWRLGSRTLESTDDGWRDVSSALGVDEGRLVRARQVHGTNAIVGTVAAARAERPQADIILVNEAAAAAAVQVADCVPMLAVDRATGAVAAVHAGWRGMVARAPQVAIAALTRTFATRPQDLLVALGPSIGACCYEVGIDVRDEFGHAGFSDVQLERWFHRHPGESVNNPTSPPVLAQARRPQHWFLDGWAVVREQLVEAGVPDAQVFASALCTASHPGIFCSYRRDGSPSGRIAGAIRCHGAV